MSRQIFIVVGSRPEAIKLAPVAQALAATPGLRPIVCSTGQQRHMIPAALQEFGLRPEIELDVMAPNQTLGGLTARLAERLDAALAAAAPDYVLVQGDTTSAMVGALTAFYRRVPVGHVEAGLRTGNVWSPFPEELNRRIVTQCASVHFAPTERCEANLLMEGVTPSRIFVTGNTVVDALLASRERIRRSAPRLPGHLCRALDGRRLILVTSHRRENFDGGLERICIALRRIVESVEDAVVALPVHPNPVVTETVERHLRNHPGVLLLEPLPYGVFLELLDRSFLVMTDSGGLQEEAPSFGKPLLVLRDTTERPEGVDAGVARLVGTQEDDIVANALELLRERRAYRRMATSTNPYGDGTAARRIAAILRQAFAGPSISIAPPAAIEPPSAPLAAGVQAD